MLYVAQEVERGSSISPQRRGRPADEARPLQARRPARCGRSADDRTGMWATARPSHGGVGAWLRRTDRGRIFGVDQETGEILWEKKLPGPTWPSPVVVDDVLILGDCNGVLHGYDVSDPRVDPPELWTVQLEGCVESHPDRLQGPDLRRRPRRRVLRHRRPRRRGGIDHRARPGLTPDPSGSPVEVNRTAARPPTQERSVPLIGSGRRGVGGRPTWAGRSGPGRPDDRAT